MTNSFIAFFDILGFKNLVEKNSHEDLKIIYEDMIYQSLELAEKYWNMIYPNITPNEEKKTLDIQTYVISDSIIFIQNSITERGLLYLISVCKVFLSATMGDGIPLRGAISFGPVTIENKRGTTVFGLGLTRAYELESQQQWSGAIIDKECFEIIPQIEKHSKLIDRLLQNKINPLIVKYMVPLKTGLSEQFAFDWTEYAFLKTEKDIENAFSANKKETTDPSIKIKIMNTKEFFLKMKNSR
ncbi:hypothetical protein [Aequorivita sp. CIP111184]|uniref:hypothetical protein n=1 Tax=Aequorivita sp. CIP111184 TaxID=2211356 RepID=UPI000DBBBBC4|nr:hypothetical protein [Aequorivita sp. CIP111184]SRX51959.1 hypothetical protein AEQU1_00019 [Aequorivita sp. CIP111184]